MASTNDETVRKLPPADPDHVRVAYYPPTSKRKNNKRIITIAYRIVGRDGDIVTVEYGAAVFRPESESHPGKKDTWNKKGHRETATRRLKKRPKRVSFTDNPSRPYMDFVKSLRNQLPKEGNGVGGHRLDHPC